MGHVRVLTATDLGIDLDELAAEKSTREWIYLDGVGPWEARQHDAVHDRRNPCPVCGGAVLPKKRYCSYCDRAGLDGCVVYPGLPINTRPHPDYPKTPRAYRPGKLQGGIGTPRTRKRVKPA